MLAAGRKGLESHRKKTLYPSGSLMTDGGIRVEWSFAGGWSGDILRLSSDFGGKSSLPAEYVRTVSVLGLGPVRIELDIRDIGG